jgi:hypothetical protein
MDFSICKIMPHVYHLDFGLQYDLAMHFVRFQEYYESPKFYKKFFSINEYMRWYAQVHGNGAFIYTKDWSGFNVPSWALIEVRDGPIPDPNEYDRLMACLIDLVRGEEEDHPFYFIGTFAGGNVDKHGKKDDILDHETAHAFFTVDEEYREQAERLAQEMDEEQFNAAYDILGEMGYHASTRRDEIHAYAATGLCEKLEGVISKKEMKPFQRLFKEYKKKCEKSK